MTREIKLSQGKVALVDDDDFDRLNQWKWYYMRHAGGYALRTVYTPGHRDRHITIYMHRAILDAPVGVQIDHINGNSLDNRRANLRPATHAQNMANRKAQTGHKTTSRYAGVTRASSRTWAANINHHHQSIYLGVFKNEIDAARAFDSAARQLRGEFARLNFPDDQN